MLPSLPFLTLYSFGLFLTGSSHFLGIPQKRKPTSKSSLWIKACVCKQLFPHCHVLAYVSQNFLVACKCCVLFACGDSRETIRLATRHNSSLIAFFAFVLAAGHESLRERAVHNSLTSITNDYILAIVDSRSDIVSLPLLQLYFCSLLRRWPFENLLQHCRTRASKFIAHLTNCTRSPHPSKFRVIFGRQLQFIHKKLVCSSFDGTCFVTSSLYLVIYHNSINWLYTLELSTSNEAL